MNKQDRELLVISLFGYFPYKCMVRVEKEYHEEVYEEFFGYSVEPYDSVLNLIMLEQLFFSTDENYVIKPYLRPLSSMTDEENIELSKRYVFDIVGNKISIRYHCEGYWDDDTECPTSEYIWLIDWLLKHHFDYRGLIDMGLALPAPEGMYNFNN